MNDVKRWTEMYYPPGSPLPKVATMVLASDYDAKAAECAAVIQDCHILCNALQRIEAGEAEPRMIARRTLEHWSEKSALKKTSHE